MSLIAIEHLCQTFGSGETLTPVLHDLTICIDRGEFVSIMGPSGSGKSTLLHILGFLATHTGGVYRFNGKTMAEHSEDEVAQVRNEEMGFVFQSFNLLGRSTVYENVRLPLLYSKRPERQWDARITAAIERVGLSHRRDYLAYKLSGGEKQRVAVARALVNEPRVIFADEPTGNLDSASGGAVMDMIRELHEAHGHTIVLITHDREIAEYAQRSIVLRDGRIEEDRPTARHAAQEAAHE
jgi:putative ABC transport system ATP-binding protein